MLSTFFLVYFISQYLALTSAQNNTNSSNSQPACTDGYCVHEVPPGNNSMGGKMEFFGDKESLADLTASGGWTILNCHPSASMQNVTMQCTNSSGCGQLFEGGAEGTIVKLPAGCAGGVAGHVSQYNGVENGTDGQVHSILLDTNFTAAYQRYNRTESNKSPVSFLVRGSTRPSFYKNASLSSLVSASSVNSKTPTKRQSNNNISVYEDSESNWWDVDTEKESNPINITVNRNLNLYQNSISCYGGKASMTLSAGANVNVVMDLGVVANGSLADLSISKLQVFGGLAGIASFDVELAAQINDNIGINNQTLFEQGLPDLSFGEVFTIGPAFAIYGSANVGASAPLSATLTTQQDIGSSLIEIPNTDGQSFVDLLDASVPIEVSGNAGVKASATVSLNPRFILGITALNNEEKADVYVDVTGGLTLSVGETATGNASTQNTSSSSNGCVDLAANVAIDAGVTGGISSALQGNNQITLWSKSDDLYHQCAGSQSAKRRRDYEYEGFSKRAASCFGNAPSNSSIVPSGTTVHTTNGTNGTT